MPCRLTRPQGEACCSRQRSNDSLCHVAADNKPLNTLSNESDLPLLLRQAHMGGFATPVSAKIGRLPTPAPYGRVGPALKGSGPLGKAGRAGVCGLRHYGCSRRGIRERKMVGASTPVLPGTTTRIKPPKGMPGKGAQQTNPAGKTLSLDGVKPAYQRVESTPGCFLRAYTERRPASRHQIAVGDFQKPISISLAGAASNRLTRKHH
jgi:hypothetical protein